VSGGAPRRPAADTISHGAVAPATASLTHARRRQQQQREAVASATSALPPAGAEVAEATASRYCADLAAARWQPPARACRPRKVQRDPPPCTLQSLVACAPSACRCCWRATMTTVLSCTRLTPQVRGARATVRAPPQAAAEEHRQHAPSGQPSPAVPGLQQQLHLQVHHACITGAAHVCAKQQRNADLALPLPCAALAGGCRVLLCLEGVSHWKEHGQRQDLPGEAVRPAPSLLLARPLTGWPVPAGWVIPPPRMAAPSCARSPCTPRTGRGRCCRSCHAAGIRGVSTPWLFGASRWLVATVLRPAPLHLHHPPPCSPPHPPPRPPPTHAPSLLPPPRAAPAPAGTATRWRWRMPSTRPC
jgi:hypothetical protein